MRSIVAALLLLVQLSPIAGAGLCMRASLQPVEECAMPMADAAPQHEQPPSDVPHDCALMIVCTPTNTVVPAVAMQNFDSVQPATTNFSSPPSLFVGDNVAPPQPPPIV